jgi:hypothetical protein
MWLFQISKESKVVPTPGKEYLQVRSRSRELVKLIPEAIKCYARVPACLELNLQASRQQLSYSIFHQFPNFLVCSLNILLLRIFFPSNLEEISSHGRQIFILLDDLLP